MILARLQLNLNLKSIEDGTFGNKKICKQVINNQNGDVDM